MRYLIILIWGVVLLPACNGKASTTEQHAESETGRLKVLASNSIIFDVVKHVGGDLIDLDVLLPIGMDPHSFEPTPQDITKLTHADVFFINGVGLETFLDPLVEASGGDFKIVDLSEDLELIELEETRIEGDDDHELGGYDPHIWMDPNNVILWVSKITQSLSELDAVNSSKYEARADEYVQELVELDGWIVDQVEHIPSDQRRLITDHLVFGYFAQRYGFEQIGAVLQSFSTQSQASAQEVAALEDAIQKEGVKAIFVGVSVNPNLARRIAEDTNIQLIFVHTGSLTEPGGPADNYIDLIRFDVEAIVAALR